MNSVRRLSLSFTACCCIALGMLIFRFLKYYTLKIKQRESYFIAFSAGSWSA